MDLYAEIKDTDEYKEILNLGYEDQTTPHRSKMGGFYFKNKYDRAYYITRGGQIRCQPLGVLITGGDPKSAIMDHGLNTLEDYREALIKLGQVIKRYESILDKRMDQLLQQSKKVIAFVFEHPNKVRDYTPLRRGKNLEILLKEIELA